MQRYGKLGPFLFGAFCGADAMYAPVVHRFRTYAIAVAPEAQHYFDAMMSLPAFQEWTRDGLAETLVIERFETGVSRAQAGSVSAGMPGGKLRRCRAEPLRAGRRRNSRQPPQSSHLSP